MLVSFLVFGKISYFPCGKIFSFFSSYFWAYLKAFYPYILQIKKLIKIESLSFSLVLSRTFELIVFFRCIHSIDLSINLSIVDCGVFIP